MEHKKLASIREVLWNDVKKEVEKIKPEFTHIIDSLNSRHGLYVVEYPFGSIIIDEGVFFLPDNEGRLVPLNDPRIDTKIQSQLGYNDGSIPFGLVLDGSVELYMQPEHRIIPFGLMKKGKLFAFWGVLNKTASYFMKHIWSMVAGPRCVFVLPKITEVNGYKKLSRVRNIKLPLPRNLLDQWLMFRQMSSHPEFKDVWRVRMLFFSKDWLTKHKEDKWAKFRLYLHEEAWESTEYWRNKVAYDLIWDSFVRELDRQYISVSPNTIDRVKHLIMIGLGVIPGFAPATDEEGPIEGLSDDLLNIYGLKHFAPIIMVPRHFSFDEKEPVYWSFQLPTYFESSPKAQVQNSIISKMRETKQLLDNFYKSVREGRIKEINNTPIYDLVQNVTYDFFHSELDMEGNIRQAADMPKEDPRLANSAYSGANTKFSDTSPFVRGCVRISRKK